MLYDDNLSIKEKIEKIFVDNNSELIQNLEKNGLNIDLGKIKDVSSLAKEIAGVEEKNE